MLLGGGPIGSPERENPSWHGIGRRRRRVGAEGAAAPVPCDRARRRDGASAAEFTGHGDDEVRRRALDGGAIAVLDKPFDDQSLLDAVEWALAS